MEAGRLSLFKACTSKFMNIVREFSQKKKSCVSLMGLHRTQLLKTHITLQIFAFCRPLMAHGVMSPS